MQTAGTAQRARRHGWGFRTFLRRRRIDPLLLALGVALLPFGNIVSVPLLVALAGSGTYFILFHPQVLRRLDWTYLAAACAYGAAAILIGLLHGELASALRWVSYPSYFALAAPSFMAGWTLVRDPLRQCVLGARAGVALAVLFSLAEILVTGADRAGLGTNPANMSLVVAMLAVLSRMRVSTPPAFLANSRLWFYAALIPILLSGTRITMVVIVVGLLFDIGSYLAGRQSGTRGILAPGRMVAATTAALALVLSIGLLSGEMIEQRLGGALVELRSIADFQSGNVPGNGMIYRLLIWEKALQLIAENPVTGPGTDMTPIIEHVRAVYPDVEPYPHSHNFVVDELRQRGMIGLAFMALFFAVALRRIWLGNGTAVRRNLMLLLVLLVSYGSFHGVLMADKNVIAIVLCFSAYLAACNGRRGA
ncbi:MAG: O-antigen ligase family protein [Rhizobiaceae bacterium]